MKFDEMIKKMLKIQQNATKIRFHSEIKVTLVYLPLDV